MDAEGKAVLIAKLRDVRRGEKRNTLQHLKIPESTYYSWRKVLYQEGVDGLIKKPRTPYRVWNKMLDEEEAEIVKKAREHTDLSPRLLAVKITDTGSFSVSEKTVQRILKKHGLLMLRPPSERPAAKEWKNKTSRPDEIWQMDGTALFIADWGNYKYLPVLDDYSRRVMNSQLMPDESGFSASDAMELSLEEAKRMGHCLDRHPIVLTDNGPAFKGWVLADYLENRGMKHIYGRPYHPQTQGKVERVNRTFKDHIFVHVYNSPDELQKVLHETADWYNDRPHEAHQNVSPNDVYAGRKEQILEARAVKKKLTLERRKAYNQDKNLGRKEE